MFNLILDSTGDPIGDLNSLNLTTETYTLFLWVIAKFRNIDHSKTIKGKQREN